MARVQNHLPGLLDNRQMAYKPTRTKKPRSPKLLVTSDHPEITKSNSEKLFDLMRSKIVYIGTFAAALVSILTLASNWDNFHIPRLAFNTELHSVRKQVYSLEAEFRLRAKRNDQRAIYELEEKISSLRTKQLEVPDELYQQKDRILEDLKDNQEKLDRIFKKLHDQ